MAKFKLKINSNQPGVANAMSEFDNPKNKPSMSKGPNPAKDKTEETSEDTPLKILSKTSKKSGKKASRKKAIAILLSKAKQA